MGRVAPWLFLALVPCLASTACNATVTYSTTSTLQSTRLDDLWRDDRYRYVATGLTASAHAPVDSKESVDLAARAMDALVARAGLKANQALSHVTLEEGTIEQEGAAAMRVITARADVIELLPEVGR